MPNPQTDEDDLRDEKTSRKEIRSTHAKFEEALEALDNKSTQWEELISALSDVKAKLKKCQVERL